ncbi:MAG: LapA family protein [Pseudomonadota bacterium]
MRLLKKVFFIVLIIAIVLILGDFVASNTQEITISFLRKPVGPIPLYLIILLSIGSGILFMILLVFFEILRSGVYITHLRRKVNKLNKKLDKVSNEAE